MRNPSLSGRGKALSLDAPGALDLAPRSKKARKVKVVDLGTEPANESEMMTSQHSAAGRPEE